MTQQQRIARLVAQQGDIHERLTTLIAEMQELERQDVEFFDDAYQAVYLEWVDCQVQDILTRREIREISVAESEQHALAVA